MWRNFMKNPILHHRFTLILSFPYYPFPCMNTIIHSIRKWYSSYSIMFHSLPDMAHNQERNQTTTTSGGQPKYLRYATYQRRVDSFETLWSKSLPVNIPTLALNGFFHTGRSDLVVCYHCGEGFHNLSHGDHIPRLHAMTNGNCGFLHKVYNREFIATMNKLTPTANDLTKTIQPTIDDFVILRIFRWYAAIRIVANALQRYQNVLCVGPQTSLSTNFSYEFT